MVQARTAGRLAYTGRVSATLRDEQLQVLCDVLGSVDASAPTLCEGWSAHDIAIHIWVLKHDPLSWPLLVVPRLAGLATKRADALKQRWSYAELVADLRSGDGEIACMPLDGRENHRHALGEYFVHSEDVRRANALHPARISPALEDALWQRLRVAAPRLHRGESWRFEAPDGEWFTIGGHEPTQCIFGRPAELLLWAYGRTSAADVTVRPA